MVSQFYFKDFIPDKSLKAEADRVLDLILDQAPYGSIAIALMERQGDQYRCSVDVYTKHGPFIANTTQSSGLFAVAHVHEILLGKFQKWKKQKLEVKSIKTTGDPSLPFIPLYLKRA